MESTEIRDQLKAISEQNAEILRRTDLISKSIDEFNQRFETIEHRVDTLEKDYEEYDQQLNYMREEINNLKQAQLELNILINGMPEYKEETQQQTVLLVTTLFNYLKLEANTSITSAKRIGRKNGAKPRPIVLKMSSRYHKELLLTAKKGQKITSTKLLDESAPKSDIYIDEQLTQENGALFKTARERGKKLGTKFVWIKNGVILMKQTEESQAFSIRNESDLEHFSSSARKLKNDGPANGLQRTNKLKKHPPPPPGNTRSTTAAAAQAAATETITGQITTSTGSANLTDVLAQAIESFESHNNVQTATEQPSSWADVSNSSTNTNNVD